MKTTFGKAKISMNFMFSYDFIGVLNDQMCLKVELLLWIGFL